MIVLPPLLGAVQDAVSLVSAAVSVGAAGLDGVVRGVALVESDQPLSPAAFDAWTCTSYSVPLVSEPISLEVPVWELEVVQSLVPVARWRTL